MKKVAETSTAEAEAEVVPSAPVEAKPAATEEGAEQESPGFDITSDKEKAKEAKFSGPEAMLENLDFIIRHASGKRLSEGEIAEANFYAQKLKYPKGALVFNGTHEDDFLYCLPDNKEISKERCFEKSLDCVKKLKTSFSKVGAYSSKENFIQGDPEGVIEWISGEAEAFEKILNDRGDICAFSGARGIAAILEKARCDHVKTTAQAEGAFSIDDIKDPSAEATLMGRKFYSNFWANSGRELANKIIKKNEKDTHDAREEARRAECWNLLSWVS